MLGNYIGSKKSHLVKFPQQISLIATCGSNKSKNKFHLEHQNMWKHTSSTKSWCQMYFNVQKRYFPETNSRNSYQKNDEQK